ncbi:hypothetical protein BJ085DRAFT_28606 [Dimargaris cristalligena]|uniref:Integrator complex subunit 7 N-terminal domain-containing protein n=1 Tax=Dimargaris cristalligena TaxID=215637 RepID=A0A4V1J4L6_9FUNG|nr:hypothetical protein BJ085DRAFT_28606 [Dimargaris cristalligena]|eukprot:RKP35989.1 hypothetical protein BJ085DRAFT_28606 [Dimargaris cristalligena]
MAAFLATTRATASPTPPPPAFSALPFTTRPDAFDVIKDRDQPPTADVAFKRLLELEAACRQQRLGTQIRAILEFERLFRHCPFPLIVNTGFLKLAELFRSGHNGLRYFILQTFYRLQSYMGRILNSNELARRILAVVGMTDPLARILALRTLGCFARRLGERLDVQHAILRRLSSTHPVEAAAAIHAADQVCQASASFPKALWPTLTYLIHAPRTLGPAKCRLVYMLRHMYKDPALADEARRLCFTWLSERTASELSLYVMKTATHLATHTLVDIGELLNHVFSLLDHHHHHHQPQQPPSQQALAHLKKSDDQPSSTANTAQLWQRETLICIRLLTTRDLVFRPEHLTKLITNLKANTAHPELAQLAVQAIHAMLNRPDLPMFPTPPGQRDQLVDLVTICHQLLNPAHLELAAAAGQLAVLITHIVELDSTESRNFTPTIAMNRTTAELTVECIRVVSASSEPSLRPALERLFAGLVALGHNHARDSQSAGQWIPTDRLFSLYLTLDNTALRFIDQQVYRFYRQSNRLADYIVAIQAPLQELKSQSHQPPSGGKCDGALIQIFTHGLMALGLILNDPMESRLDLPTLSESFHNQWYTFLRDRSVSTAPSSVPLYRAFRKLAAYGSWRAARMTLDPLLQQPERPSSSVTLWWNLLQFLADRELTIPASPSASPSATKGLLDYTLRNSDALDILGAISSLGFDRTFQCGYLSCHAKFKDVCRLGLIWLRTRELNPTQSIDLRALHHLIQTTEQLSDWLRCLQNAFSGMDQSTYYILDSYALVTVALQFHFRQWLEAAGDTGNTTPVILDPTVVHRLTELRYRESKRRATVDSDMALSSSHMPVDNNNDGDGDDNMMHLDMMEASEPDSAGGLTDYALYYVYSLTFTYLRSLPDEVWGPESTAGSVPETAEGLPRLEEDNLRQVLQSLGQTPLYLSRFWFNSPEHYLIQLSAEPQPAVPNTPLAAQGGEIFMIKVEGFLRESGSTNMVPTLPASSAVDGGRRPSRSKYIAVDTLTFVSTRARIPLEYIYQLSDLYQWFVSQGDVKPY